MIDIFISYSHKDRLYAHAIAEMLVRNGYNVWWDVDLLPGQQFADEINSVIHKAKATIVLWSEYSISSKWVKAETTLALKQNSLIPVWLHKVDLPAPYNTLHTLDLSTWGGDTDEVVLSKLLNGVEALVGKKLSVIKELDKQNIQVVLEKPAHEAEFWLAVSNKNSQSITEYEAYLEKYGQMEVSQS